MDFTHTVYYQNKNINTREIELELKFTYFDVYVNST